MRRITFTRSPVALCVVNTEAAATASPRPRRTADAPSRISRWCSARSRPPPRARLAGHDAPALASRTPLVTTST
jgi:hypothetical protein